MGSRVSSSHMAHIAALAEPFVLLTSRHGLRSAWPSIGHPLPRCRIAFDAHHQPACTVLVRAGPVLPTSMVPGCSVASSAGREPPPSQRSCSSSDPSTRPQPPENVRSPSQRGSSPFAAAQPLLEHILTEECTSLVQPQRRACALCRVIRVDAHLAPRLICCQLFHAPSLATVVLEDTAEQPAVRTVPQRVAAALAPHLPWAAAPDAWEGRLARPLVAKAWLEQARRVADVPLDAAPGSRVELQQRSGDGTARMLVRREGGWCGESGTVCDMADEVLGQSRSPSSPTVSSKS